MDIVVLFILGEGKGGKANILLYFVIFFFMMKNKGQPYCWRMFGMSQV